jgi:hypothetical protein
VVSLRLTLLWVRPGLLSFYQDIPSAKLATVGYRSSDAFPNVIIKNCDPSFAANIDPNLRLHNMYEDC